MSSIERFHQSVLNREVTLLCPQYGYQQCSSRHSTHISVLIVQASKYDNTRRSILLVGIDVLSVRTGAPFVSPSNDLYCFDLITGVREALHNGFALITGDATHSLREESAVERRLWVSLLVH